MTLLVDVDYPEDILRATSHTQTTCLRSRDAHIVKDGAAAILGIHPSTLRARMHKLGIVRLETRDSD